MSHEIPRRNVVLGTAALGLCSLARGAPAAETARGPVETFAAGSVPRHRPTMGQLAIRIDTS
jgi:hypothetical protein